MLAVVSDSLGYKIVYLLHILAVLVAFAPSFVNPGLRRTLGKQDANAQGAVLDQLSKADRKVHGPAIVAAGFFGMLMIVLSPDLGDAKVYEMSQMWISIAFLLWLLMIGLVFGYLAPLQKKASAAPSPENNAKLATGSGALHILLLLMLIDMVFKPGL